MKKLILFALSYILSLSAFANPLPVSEVFQVQVKPVDPNNFSLNWVIKPGYFLYSDRIKLTAPSDSNARLGTLRLPLTTIKKDKKGRTYTVYKNELSLTVPVLGE